MEWLKNVLETDKINFEDEGMTEWLMKFQALMIDAHNTAVEKGFWEEERPDTDAIALMHSELSEALEYWRKGNQPDDKLTNFDGASVELADTIIRIWDTCAERGYWLVEALSGLLDKNGEGVIVSSDWVNGFNQLADRLANSEIIGQQTSFATDLAFAHADLTDTMLASLDESDEEEIGEHYAKVVLMLMAMGGKYKLNVAEAILVKMAYNKSRPYKHGKKF